MMNRKKIENHPYPSCNLNSSMPSADPFDRLSAKSPEGKLKPKAEGVYLNHGERLQLAESKCRVWLPDTTNDKTEGADASL